MLSDVAGPAQKTAGCEPQIPPPPGASVLRTGGRGGSARAGTEAKRRGEDRVGDTGAPQDRLSGFPSSHLSPNHTYTEPGPKYPLNR